MSASVGIPLIWVPKYRYSLLGGEVGRAVKASLRLLYEWKRIEILELSVQPDHVHQVAQIPPKISVSQALGILKGKSKDAQVVPRTEEEAVLGEPLLARGYSVTTMGMDEEKIRR